MNYCTPTPNFLHIGMNEVLTDYDAHEDDEGDDGHSYGDGHSRGASIRSAQDSSSSTVGRAESIDIPVKPQALDENRYMLRKCFSQFLKSGLESSEYRLYLCHV